MSETRQILTLVGITLLIGVLAVGLIGYLPSLVVRGGDAVVEEYSATFYPDGTLVEEYSYTIKARRFKFLFRIWEAPLSAQALDQPYIEPVEVEAVPGAIAYVKDYRGAVFMEEPYNEDQAISETISSKAMRNEVGSYRPDYYDAGSYKARYVFDVHPPLEYDSESGHLNIKLASEHIPYKKVTLVFEDSEYIEGLYPHPPSMRVVDEGDRIVVDGSSGKDEILEVEMLIDLDAVQGLGGFPRNVDSVRARTVNANRLTSLQYYGALALKYGTRALALLMPFMLYAMYFMYGRERDYAVPRYLSYLPNKDRKPWMVNQIFAKGALDYDDDGFYATLLDLHMRKKIRIETKPGGLLIEILDRGVDDVYEKRVMGFLDTLASDGIVDTDRIADYAQAIKEGELKIGSIAFSLRNQLLDLTTNVDERVASKFIVKGKWRVAPLLALAGLVTAASLGMAVLVPWTGSIIVSAIFISFVPIIQSVIALMFPSELFGKWRGEAYKEKLKWDAFARHLSDLSRLGRYAPDDISMWGEWLVYGTALGVGDSVVRAMRELEVDIPEAVFSGRMPIFFHPLVVASAPSRGGRAGGSGGGGSFGGGGGFGGGGAGVR